MHFLLSSQILKQVIACCSILSIAVSSIKAQTNKHTENLNQVWLGYFNQTRFSSKWGMWTDLNLRTKDDFVNNFSVSIVRVGLTYYVTNDTKITAGYAWVNFFPGDNHKNISQPEHRPWLQIQWHTKYGNKRMMQWIRLEERFRHKILNDDALAPGYNFNFKLRYNLWYEIPLTKKAIAPGSLSFILNDEVHINFGKQVVNNYFDQNRFFAGFKWQTGSTTNMQLGYLNVFQQLVAGNQYKNINGVRLFFFQNIDLRHKE